MGSRNPDAQKISGRAEDIRTSGRSPDVHSGHVAIPTGRNAALAANLNKAATLTCSADACRQSCSAQLKARLHTQTVSI